MKKINCIFIDATKNIVSEVVLDDHFSEISKALNCEVFCCGARLTTGDIMYVDDMGWISESVTRAFSFGNNGKLIKRATTFAGNGLIMGVDNEGASQDTKAKLLDVASEVEFAPDDWVISSSLRHKVMSSGFSYIKVSSNYP